MRQVLNTLYVQTQGAYLHIKDDSLRVEVESTTRLSVPFHHLGGATVFGNVSLSPFLIHRFAEDGRFIAWFSEFGLFKARLEGPTTGNVLLRHAQYEAAGESGQQVYLARQFAMGKIRNGRHVLMRGLRGTDAMELYRDEAVAELDSLLVRIKQAKEVSSIRGFEGRAAVVYFDGLRTLMKNPDPKLRWDKRTRRPPRDPFNSVLSFAYSLLVNDCAAACEGVGLDPQIGFLHTMRPGRPALALDLAEEFRPIFGDRLVLSLFNRRQLAGDDFLERPAGAVQLTEEGRTTFLTAYQKRKQDEVMHPLLKQRVSVGLLPHIQARLLARYIRGDVSDYVPYLVR